jgi:membrane protein implicated in regulation of membrane protease activity
MAGSSWIETIYWGSTIIGGTLFILRTILFLIGGGLGDDLHIDGDVYDGHDVDFDPDHGEAIADSDFSFKLLSMQGLTAFFMMFGLIGLALLRANLATAFTIVGGTAAGLFAVWLISLLFSQMKKLQSDGTVIIQNALGQTGTVYLNIPTKGSGQVQVAVQGSLRIYDAVTEGNKAIPTGTKVRVVSILENNTLVVEKI